MYQGDAVQMVYQPIYEQLLTDRLLPLLLQAIEDDLRGRAGSPSQYEILKIYLMLSPEYEDHYDDLALIYYSSHLLGVDRGTPINSLMPHLETLFAERPAAMSVSRRLTREVRQEISQRTLGEMAWQQIHLDYIAQSGFGGFSLSRALGPKADAVFRLKDEDSLAREIPGLFTASGYQAVWLTNRFQTES